MAPVSKTKKFESLTKLLQKRFKGLPAPPERTVLEHLIYAALLENATYELADSAFAVLENYFIDWNEIRVSTVRELADTFSMLPDPAAAGERVRKSLQGVFEKTYMFDLEELRKKGKSLSQAVEFLKDIPSCTPFMVDFTIQVAFAGHTIPMDEATLRIFRLLGLTQVNKEGTLEEVPGLERAISKKDGLSFSLQLHHFAAGYFSDPESAELRTILKSIDAEATKRDWTPPALVVVKKVSKPVPERPLPTVTLPFATGDDDDFEDEAVGTEAEFLPDDSPFRSDDDLPGRYDDDDDASSHGGKKSKSKEKKKHAEPAKAVPKPIPMKDNAVSKVNHSSAPQKPKKETPKPEVSPKIEPKHPVAKAKPEPPKSAAAPPKSKSSAKPVAKPSNPDTPKPKASVPPPKKEAPKEKKVPPSNPLKKKTPEPKGKKTAQSPKSSTRKLRENKPK